MTKAGKSRKKEIVFFSQNKALISQWRKFAKIFSYKLVFSVSLPDLKRKSKKYFGFIFDYNAFSRSPLKTTDYLASLRRLYPEKAILLLLPPGKRLPAAQAQNYILSCRYPENKKEAENILANLKVYSLLLAAKRESEDKVREVEKREKSLELIDYLTGTYNYHYFRRRLEEEFKRAKRFLRLLYLVVLDIDYLDNINDELGEKMGDKVICQLSGLLKKTLRANDLLSYLGGGRFSLIISELSSEDIKKAISRIYAQVEHSEFGTKKYPLAVKISMGIAAFPYKNIDSASKLFKAAKVALDYAKSKGGGQASFYFDKIVYLRKKKQLEDLRLSLENLNRLLSQSVIDVVYGFAKTIEAKDKYTGNHVEETAKIAVKLGKMFGLSQKALNDLSHAAILHDLGKVAIDEKILLKKGKLSRKEWEIIKKHPVIGSEIIKTIHALKDASVGVLYHHEKYDGSGYPEKLKGENIPLIARIVSIADVYQALTSDRPYRKAFPQQKALAIIKKESGIHFDPQVVKAFLKTIKSKPTKRR